MSNYNKYFIFTEAIDTILYFHMYVEKVVLLRKQTLISFKIYGKLIIL